MQCNAKQSKAKQAMHSKEKQSKAMHTPESVTRETFFSVPLSPAESVTYDTFSVFLVAPQNPLHVTRFLFSLQTPVSVTCDTLHVASCIMD